MKYHETLIADAGKFQQQQDKSGAQTYAEIDGVGQVAVASFRSLHRPRCQNKPTVAGIGLVAADTGIVATCKSNS